MEQAAVTLIGHGGCLLHHNRRSALPSCARLAQHFSRSLREDCAAHAQAPNAASLFAAPAKEQACV